MPSDDSIRPLPVKFKKPPEGEPPFLTVVNRWGGKDGCDHRSYYVEGRGIVPVTYQIREGETEVECSRCYTRVDPMFALKIMATEETTWSRARERYIDEMKRLRERRRAKCWHCRKVTGISRRSEAKTRNNRRHQRNPFLRYTGGNRAQVDGKTVCVVASTIRRIRIFEALVAALSPFRSSEMGGLLVDIREPNAEEAEKPLRRLVRMIDVIPNTVEAAEHDDTDTA